MEYAAEARIDKERPDSPEVEHDLDDRDHAEGHVTCKPSRRFRLETPID